LIFLIRFLSLGKFSRFPLPDFPVVLVFGKFNYVIQVDYRVLTLSLGGFNGGILGIF
jgi:hypothetical protein